MTQQSRWLIEPDAVASIDKAAMASAIPGFSLMRAAGLAVSRAALKYFPAAPRFVVLCGPGNNGGDGFVAATDLARRGAQTLVFQLGDGGGSADAERARSSWPNEIAPLPDYHPVAGDVIIDAIFGSCLSRDVPESVARLIVSVASLKLDVIAVDIPSGICGRTGQVRGQAFLATKTLTFMARKPGQLLLPGRQHCGQIEIVDIGVPERLIAAFSSPMQENHPDIWQQFLPRRQPGAHKYNYGHLMVFSGDGLSTGAARLAASAGLIAGAGLVTVLSPAEALAANAAHLTAIMLKEVNDLFDLETVLTEPRIRTYVLGPAFGIGQKARDFVLALAVSKKNLVLDADGITSFKDRPDTLFAAFGNQPLRLVLTPHGGEFARLFGDLASDAKLSKVEKAFLAAKRANAVIVYKGADTIVASPDGRAVINTNAPPQLATAGSGDVLAGMIGALLASGCPPFEAAMAGVYYHGEAGQRAGPGLNAQMLIGHIKI